MGAKDLEDLSKKLSEIGIRQAEMINKSEEKIEVQSKLMTQLVSVTDEIQKTNKTELKRLLDEVQELRMDRDATLKRCDTLLKHNKDLSDMVVARDNELVELRERYDRIVSLLETAIFNAKNQASSATVSINNGDSLKRRI